MNLIEIAMIILSAAVISIVVEQKLAARRSLRILNFAGIINSNLIESMRQYSSWLKMLNQLAIGLDKRIDQAFQYINGLGLSLQKLQAEFHGPIGSD